MEKGKRHVMYLIMLVCFAATSCSSTKDSQANHKKQSYVPVDKGLYENILSQDSALFVAFNTRNLDRLRLYFTENLEIYQDNVGIRNYEQTIESFKGLFEKDYVLTRKLIKESVEIYPIKGYGAIQTGQHTFCHTENGKLECATFKFVHIWEYKNEQWKIAKIITYDH